MRSARALVRSWTSVSSLTHPAEHTSQVPQLVWSLSNRVERFRIELAFFN